MTAARAKTISFNDVLAQTDSSFKNLFDMGLLPQLEEKRIVPRGLKKSLESKREPARIPLLLGYLKNMKPEKFIDLLSILEQSSKEHEQEETRKNTQRLVEVMSTHVRNMFAYGGEKAEAVIQSFLSTADYYKELSQSHTAKTQHRLETIQTSTTESETAIAEVETTISTGAVSSLAPVDPVSHPPLRPPPGHMIDPPAQWFTREGGTLYSPIHGIEVVILPEAPPLGVDKFWLSIHVYPRGPFVLPESVVSCSPAVWFFLSPTFEFVKDVTVRIPHSARGSVSSDVCVYRMLTGKEGTRDPPFVLSEKVEGCECDWYHTTVHVRHFSPYRNGVSSDATSEAVHRTQPQSMKHSSKHPVATGLKHLAKQRSSSFEKDSDTPDQLTVNVKQSSGQCTPPEPKVASSGYIPGTPTPAQPQCAAYANQYCIARGMPRDVSSTPWQAKFYVVQSHPSHSWEVVQAAGERDGVQVLSLKEICITGQSLEFTCRGVPQGWSVDPTDGEEITVGDLNLLHAPSLLTDCNDMIKTGAYPASITYDVDTDRTAACPLKCSIEVKGAGRPLKYVVTAKLPCKKAAGYVPKPVSLTTSLHLYDEGCLLVKQLSSGNLGVLRLDLAIDDHLRLITDVSLQLSDPIKLAQALCIDEAQFSRISHDCKNCAEQVFLLLHSWVCEKQPTIAALCSVLGANTITLTTSDSTCQVYEEQLSDQQYGELLTKEELKLARCLQACWPFVGRYLGLSEEIITAIVQQVHQMTCTDQAFEMMKTWRMMKGKEATFGRVHTAIQRLWEHDSMRSNCHNAYHCITRCLQYYHYLHKQAAQ